MAGRLMVLACVRACLYVLVLQDLPDRQRDVAHVRVGSPLLYSTLRYATTFHYSNMARTFRVGLQFMHTWPMRVLLKGKGQTGPSC
jgi:hypothetical protein